MAEGRGPIERAVALGARNGGKACPADPANGPAAAGPSARARAMAVAATSPRQAAKPRAPCNMLRDGKGQQVYIYIYLYSKHEIYVKIC